MISKRHMAGLSGSVIELSNYLEQRISQKSAEYAAVSSELLYTFHSSHHFKYCFFMALLVFSFIR